MEFFAACENRESANVAASQCEVERIWRMTKRIWTFDQLEEEVPTRTWDEMFFSGGGGVIEINQQVNKDLAEKRGEDDSCKLYSVKVTMP